jgi:Flp pilus assembly pilin Flp
LARAVQQKDTILSRLGQIIRNSRAAAPLEYALIASMIAVVISFALTNVNLDLGNVFNTLVAQFDQGSGSGAGSGSGSSPGSGSGSASNPGSGAGSGSGSSTITTRP